MKIFMTGATGFIGCHVIPHLLNHGHELTILLRDEKSALKFSWFNQINFIIGNIFDAQNIINQLDFQDAVVHLAWEGLPHYDKAFHLENNLPADCTFLKLLIEKGIRQFLVTGTCFEYGMEEGCLHERQLTHPVSPYALAKDNLRKFLQNLQQQHSFILQWARLFYMYGPGQNARSILAQLDTAIEKGEPSFKMSGGKQQRDYLPVEEVARRLVRLLNYPSCEGIVNICSGTPIAILDLVANHLSKKQTNISLQLGYYPYAQTEPMAFWGSTDKFNQFCQNNRGNLDDK